MTKYLQLISGAPTRLCIHQTRISDGKILKKDRRKAGHGADNVADLCLAPPADAPSS